MTKLNVMGLRWAVGVLFDEICIALASRSAAMELRIWRCPGGLTGSGAMAVGCTDMRFWLVRRRTVLGVERDLEGDWGVLGSDIAS